jgi:hypothetical protein
MLRRVHVCELHSHLPIHTQPSTITTHKNSPASTRGRCRCRRTRTDDARNAREPPCAAAGGGASARTRARDTRRPLRADAAAAAAAAAAELTRPVAVEGGLPCPPPSARDGAAPPTRDGADGRVRVMSVCASQAGRSSGNCAGRSSRAMMQRFAVLLARLKDAREAQMHSGNAFKWCDAACLQRSITSIINTKISTARTADCSQFSRRRARCQRPSSRPRRCVHMTCSFSSAYLGSCADWVVRTPAMRANARILRGSVPRQCAGARRSQVGPRFEGQHVPDTFEPPTWRSPLHLSVPQPSGRQPSL